MQIKRVEVERFRGIKKLTWTVGGQIACLVGPGDSTKTTILDAIQLALSPRWNVTLHDTDFYMSQTSDGMKIAVTVGDLPREVINEFRCGLELRGWDKDSNGFSSEDEPDCLQDAVLTVQLRVDHNLEPEWCVVSYRDPEGTKVSGRTRELLGIARLGSQVDQDLAWGRGSALLRMGGGADQILQALRSAARKAGEEVDDAAMSSLVTMAKAAQQAAVEFGVRGDINYCPALDAQFVLGRMGAIGLHEQKDCKIPLRMAGLGTRRLTALAVQKECATGGAILLIDEIEQGLEPYRVRHLIRQLQNSIRDKEIGQVIFTTHCPTAVVEVDADELQIVRVRGEQVSSPVPELRCTEDGDSVEIIRVDKGRHGTVRRCGEALLSRKIVICEGATEYGLLLGMEGYWAATKKDPPYTHRGVTLVDGTGSSAADRALHLAELGYTVAIFADSDNMKEWTSKEQALKNAGVEIVRWSDGNALEEQIAADLLVADLPCIVNLAAIIQLREERVGGKSSSLEAIWGRLDTKPTERPENILDWCAAGVQESELRDAIGGEAKCSKWFKAIRKGEMLGKFVAGVLPRIPQTVLADRLHRLGDWMYAD